MINDKNNRVSNPAMAITDDNRAELVSRIDALVLEALNRLYEKDHYLICNKPSASGRSLGNGHHVGERAIVFRFALYLQNLLSDDMFSGYNLDCEYNRNGTRSKSLPSFKNGTYPDVILHKRGRNDGNLLVIEFKTYWNSNQEKDRKKIEEFTSPDGNYRFLRGYTILIGINRDDCIIDTFPK